MAKYIEKPREVEAISFDELVEYGKANGANIVNGMPWSFQYNGHGVTHENDQHYLIAIGNHTIKVTPSLMLITDAWGEMYTYSVDAFNRQYKKESTK